MGCAKVFILVAVFCIGGLLAAPDRITEEQSILDNLLGGKYNANIRPTNASNSESPIRVEVNMKIRQIHSIDEQAGTWKAHITFRQQWADTRLTFSPKASTLKYLTLPHSKVIWTPDTFFSNEIESKEHSLWRPNQYIRIFPNGQVLFSSRITVTFSSPSLGKPASPTSLTRTSNIRLSSYAYTDSDIQYEWKAVEPIQILTTDLSLRNFVFQKFTTGFCNSATATGTYSCLKADFDFTKVVGVGVCNVV